MSDPGTSAVRDLADRLSDRLFTAAPFEASELGISGYDDRVPDETPEGEAALRADLGDILASVRATATEGLALGDRVTLRCTADTAERVLLAQDNAEVEHVVTAMPFAGLAVLFAVAARTRPTDADAAQRYLDRLAASSGWMDAVSERLRAGAAKGRVPVRALVEQAISWADTVLADPEPGPIVAPPAPDGWSGADAWRAEVSRLARDVVAPGLARWRDLLADELLAVSRDDEHCGLLHLPGGSEDYLRDIRIHTTLAATADELHAMGVEAIEALEAHLVALGRETGTTDLAELRAALRNSAEGVDTGAAMAAARDAIRRAEARAHEVFPDPLPGPCAVEEMPPSVGEAGTAPHYTPPRHDGSRPGTYWFNTRRATAGTGWDLEGVAFHEAVPGHHLQLSRAQLLTAVPFLQQVPVTAHAEGWGLYSEQLADEMELYSDVRMRMGAVTAALMRAARLVVDTGMHALGWSRERAAAYMIEHVPMPEGFLRNEIDRYLVMPGQALAYHSGKVEILRLRAEAQQAMGERFTLPGFHAAVLDQGSVPMPVLADMVREWSTSGG